MHVQRVRTLVLLLLSSIIALNMVTSDSFACSLVGRADIATKPSFLLELAIRGEVDDLSLLQDDIRQAFDIARGSFVSDVSETVRDNIGKVPILIPFYAEAEWSLNEEQYDLLIYYYDNERQFSPDLKDVFLKTSVVKLAHLSMNPLQSIVYLESDCRIFPVSTPSKEFTFWVASLHNLGIETIVKYSNELSGSRIESISFERLNYTTGKVSVKLDSETIEEFVYNDLSDVQGSSIPTPERPLIDTASTSFKNVIFSLFAALVFAGIAGGTIYLLKVNVRDYLPAIGILIVLTVMLYTHVANQYSADIHSFSRYMIGYVASFAFLPVIFTVIFFLLRKKNRQNVTRVIDSAFVAKDNVWKIGRFSALAFIFMYATIIIYASLTTDAYRLSHNIFEQEVISLHAMLFIAGFFANGVTGSLIERVFKRYIKEEANTI